MGCRLGARRVLPRPRGGLGREGGISGVRLAVVVGVWRVECRVEGDRDITVNTHGRVEEPSQVREGDVTLRTRQGVREGRG